MNEIKEIQHTFYKCSVCGVEYKTRSEAEKRCGSYLLEAPKFAVGELVRTFGFVGGCSSKPCFLEGRVTAIVGPTIGNFVGEGGKRLSGKWGHVYKYELLCSCAKKRESPQFWGSELIKVS